MPDYVLELEADTDMLEIGRYTARRWGLDQMDVYLGGLESHFSAIAKRKVREEPVFEHREDFRVSRCDHHYVYFVREEGTVIILAVFHENMNRIERLRERLGWMGRRL